MNYQPKLYALKHLSANGNIVSICDYTISVISETIFTIDKNKTEYPEFFPKIYKKEDLKKLASYNRDSLYRIIKDTWTEQELKKKFQSFLPAQWCYDSVDENTIDIQKFINTITDYECKNHKEYPIVKILCGNKIYKEDKPQTIVEDARILDFKTALCNIYDTLVESRGGISQTSQTSYIWEWHISQSEYNKLKELLKTYVSCIKDILTDSKCSFLIVAFIAEEYKREWNGNNINYLSSELGTSVYKALCDIYFAGERGKLLFKHDESGNTEWLNSIRIEGGLPINYIVSGNNALERFAINLYKNRTAAIQILSNKSLINSFEKDYSIGKFVSRLLEGESICSEGDSSLELYEKFYKLLQEGKQTADRESHKFTLNYSVWKWPSPEEFVVHKNISLKRSEYYNEAPDLISMDRIKNKWMIENPTYIFWLKIGNEFYEFNPTKGGYRSDVGLVEFDMPNVDLYEYKNKQNQNTIFYIPQNENGFRETDNSKWKEIEDTVKDDNNYILFSSKDGYRWETGVSGRYWAVWVRNDNRDITTQGYVDEKQLPDGMRWIEFSGQIKIGTKVIYAGSYNVEIKDESVIHKIAKYSYIRNIQLQQGENSKNFWILDKSKVELNKFGLLNPRGGEPLEVENIEYRKYNEKEWKPIGNDSLGLVDLRFNESIIQRVLILDSDAYIERELGQNKIIVKGLAKVEDEDGKFTQNTKTFQKVYPYQASINDYVSIKIAIEEDVSLNMDIAYPWRREDRICNGMITSERVPKKFSSKYKLRIFDNNGVRYVENKQSCRLYNRNIQVNQNRYQIAQGRYVVLDENLEFVFINTSGKEYKLKILQSEERNGVNLYYLSGIPSEKGVIIQSLENKSTDLLYYEPFFINSEKNDFIRNITNFKRLLISEKHSLYYNLFIDKNDINADLFKQYIEYCKENGKTIDYKLLWQIAEDCEKDWLLIPRNTWGKKNKEEINRLFVSHPQYQRKNLHTFISNYWSLNWSGRAPQTRSDEIKRFLYYVLRGETGNYEVPCEVPDLLTINEHINIDND